MKALVIKHKVVLLLTIGAVILLQACEKEQPVCTGNCVDILIQGKITDQTTGAGMGGIPVTVTWLRRQYCIGCTSYKVAEGKSQMDGSFSFSSTIDSTFFKDYQMTVRIPLDSNYLSIPDGGGIHYREMRFYDLDISALKQIRFEYYQKVPLTIKLHRVQNDAFSYFHLAGNVLPRVTYIYYSVSGQQNAHDTTLMVQTTPGIYTYISYGKTTNSIPVNNYKDSILCTPSGPNIIDVNY